MPSDNAAQEHLGVQQVMSAQQAQQAAQEGRGPSATSTTRPGLPNGVQQLAGDVENANLAVEAGARGGASVEVSSTVPVARVEAQPQLESLEPASVREQDGRSSVHTTLDMDGGPVPATESAPRQSVTSGDFLTPRSIATVQGQSTWLGAIEWPRWMSRLGSYVAPVASELLPSPLPSQSTPPGGHPFTLSSPVWERQPRRPTTPPSSSSIPAEAIQQEVQRQLGGLLTRLEDAEMRNDRLMRDLERARSEAVEARERAQQRLPVGSGVPSGYGGLLSDPQTLYQQVLEFNQASEDCWVIRQCYQHSIRLLRTVG